MIQCRNACHDKLYDDKEMVDKMVANIDGDLKIPTSLVPKCPVCGENMEPNLRKDGNFVQDELWYQQNERYEDFLKNAKGKKLVMLEFGVGFNTPGIIRFPFEQMASINENWTLVRLNRDTKCMYGLNDKQFIPIHEDLNEIFRGEKL
ncbi:MAG: hypothetical protein IJ867_03990 [Clostridia bacterium]|nr:hypothetical protein [Clostridia bacterium]